MTMVLLSVLLLMQAPRDRPVPRPQDPGPAGTAVVIGQVTAVESGQPLRRALVSISGGPAESRGGATAQGPAARAGFVNRTVTTNAQGVFQFSALPAGTYRIRVTAGAYRSHFLPMMFGARRPQDVGKPIELADGQTVQANVSLHRGGAVGGRVVDDMGEPVSRVGVAAMRVTAGGSFQRMGMSSHTDDFGRFRLYGLEPGEYVISAEARHEGGPPVEGKAEGFATTFFPSAVSERDATRVRVAAGQDAADVEIALVRTRMFRITGSLLDSRGNAVNRPNIVVMRHSAGGWAFYSGGAMFDGNGRFTIRDLVAGQYRLTVRPGGVDGPDVPLEARRRREFAAVQISVDSDVEDIVVITQPGTTISGQLVFAEGTPAVLPEKMSIMAQYSDGSMSLGSPPNAVVGKNLQFTLTDLFGPYHVRAIGLPPGHVLKAVMLGGTDITDQEVEFKPEHNGQLQVIVTGRASTLEGAVLDDRGGPASEVTVIVLPEEKTSWKLSSPRTRLTNASDGKFRVGGLLAGRYYVVAIPRDTLRPSRDLGPEVFAPFMKNAVAVVIAEDETRTIELRTAREP